NHNVLVIGGGDTGSDCIGTSNRLGAKSVLQIELLSKPPVGRTENNPWPQWPFILRTSSSHEEGCERDWEVYTKAFLSEDGEHLSGVQVVDVRWEKGPDGRFKMQEHSDTLRTIPAEKAFLAIGFLHPAEQILLDFGLERDDRGLIQASHYRTSHPKVFTAGDARRGPSLVVWAIQEGREAANAVDRMLRAGEPGTTHALQSARSVLAL
ncbi:MAG: FAD-dependent oxidoreductase, partial [Phaeodactylibacter sp.]|nr:FAD-dependent oxidoreductase [Phaeodactylibacter sp.]